MDSMERQMDDLLYKDFDFLISNKCFQGVVFKVEKTLSQKIW